MALATEEYTRLRQDVGFAATDTVGFPDVEIDDIFAEAAEEYSGAVVIKKQTRVIALQRIWIDSAKLTTYQQNHSLEKLEDVHAHLQKNLDFWVKEREAAEKKANAGSNPSRNPMSHSGRIVVGW